MVPVMTAAVIRMSVAGALRVHYLNGSPTQSVGAKTEKLSQNKCG